MAHKTLFTKIIDGEIPAKVVYRDEQIVAIQDINPQAPTHLLVIPVKPLPSLAQAEAGDQALLGALLLAAHRVAEQAGLAAGGYRLVINTGAHAGQTVPHLHVHVLGGRPMAWPPG
ncbi:MAG: histidine triad nucleotide-binding protein [Anaerolineales bacterium]|nr:histidine triad nucleotide-binding protein [Anaerolineales bacterium]